MDKAAPDPLQAVRSRIDQIDERMHRLLIERAEVIAELIRIKGTSKPGAAFRPDREADMMRRLVARHEGTLPLVTVEHIWREIITTFTAMQAPFGVAAGPAEDTFALRDVIRFYFGFSVSVAHLKSNEAAIARVAESGTDVAVVPVDAKGRWWKGLAGARAPKVFAKLPFIATASRPADLPAYVVGPPLKERPNPNVRLVATVDTPRLQEVAATLGGLVVNRCDDEVLLELPTIVSDSELAKQVTGPARELHSLGGFSQPIRFIPERAA